jgi:hypothetical protein
MGGGFAVRGLAGFLCAGCPWISSDGVDGAPTGIDCAKMVVVRNPIS